jgi:hypothetical protein
MNGAEKLKSSASSSGHLCRVSGGRGFGLPQGERKPLQCHWARKMRAGVAAEGETQSEVEAEARAACSTMARGHAAQVGELLARDCPQACAPFQSPVGALGQDGARLGNQGRRRDGER